MPELIVYGLTYIATNAAIGATWSAFLLGNATLISMAVATLVAGSYQRQKARQRARDAYNASLQDRLVMTATTDGPRSRIYGRVRNVDGVLFKATRGAMSEYYTLIIALAGHEVDAIEDVYFNDVKVTIDVDGYVRTPPWGVTLRKSDSATMALTGGAGTVTLTYTPIDGSVRVTVLEGDRAAMRKLDCTVVGTEVSVTGYPEYDSATVTYQYESDNSFLNVVPDQSNARVRAYHGAPGQDLSDELMADFPELITYTDKFEGMALLRVDLLYSQDSFPTGVPGISAVIRGAKVYDPRDGVTRWTQNPALIARDWARYSNGGNALAVDDVSIIAAANVCDADSSFVLPSGTVTMDTYQCGIVAKLDASPSDTMSEIVESMAGRWGWAGGVLKVVAGSYRAPIADVTEDWVTDASEVAITPAPPRSDLVNAYRPTISNRDNKYQAEPAPPLIVSEYVTADGQQLDAEITMAGVTSIAHAQHICGCLLRDARQALTVQLPCNLRAFKLELFDVVTVTIGRFGWNTKTFEVMGWRWSMQAGVVLTLKEAAASVYTVDAGFADLGNEDNTELPNAWTVEPIYGLTVSSGGETLTDGSIITRTKVAWSVAQSANVLQAGHVEVQYMEATTGASGDWPGTIEGGGATQTIINGLRAGFIYLFRARFINGAGARGAWSLHVDHTISAVPPTEGATTYAQASQPASGMVAGDLWYDTDDGNKPYRYSGSAWVAIQDGSIAIAATTALWDNVTGRPQSLTLVSEGNCTYSADTITKAAGGAGWNAAMHSVESYIGGSFVSVKATVTNTDYVFGLNDTESSPSYDDVAFAWSCTAAGTCSAYERGTFVGGATTYAAGDVLTVSYDGQTVRYLKNGAIVFQHGATNSAPLFFDCSIYTQGATISGIRFGPMSTPTNRNLLDSRTWVYGASGTQPGFPALATSSGGSNTIALALLPDGSRGSVWQATSGLANGDSSEGGWNTPAFAIDSTKMYRFTVWIKASGGNGSGSFYHGPGANSVADIGGSINGNPYFNANPRSGINNVGWMLCVGYVYPATYAGAQLNSGGVWRASDGVKLITGVDFRWVSGQATTSERAYQYYTTASGNQQLFWNPRVELCDGSERSIGAMLGDAAVAQAILAVANANTAQITADGKITTFVQTTAPSAVSIGDLWFDSDDGYKLYRAGAVGSGSWAPYQFGTSALGVEAATKAQIATGSSGTIQATESDIPNGPRIAVLATLSYSNTTGNDVVCQIEANVYAAGTYTGTGSSHGWFDVYWEYGSGTNGRKTLGDSAGKLPTQTFNSYGALDQVTVPTGVTITATMSAYAEVASTSVPATSATTAYHEPTLRLTAIKR
jgi:hypothetical protein